MIKGAIFDMDGTLIDSMPLWEDCGRAFLSARGIAARDDLGETLKSLSMEQTADYLRDAYGISETTAEIIEIINGMAADAYQRTIPLKRDIAAFLERLREAYVRMCFATANDRPLAEAALGRLGLLPYFERIFTCSEVGVGKDRPDIFEQACAVLGTPRSETVVFEDALYAIETARRAGFRIVAIADDSSAGDEARIAALAEQYVHNYKECEVNSL